MLGLGYVILLWHSLSLPYKYFAHCICVCFRNLESPEIPVYSVKGHKEIINAIDGVGGLGIGEGAPEIVTGSRDGELSTQWIIYTIDSCVVTGEGVKGVFQSCHAFWICQTFVFTK